MLASLVASPSIYPCVGFGRLAVGHTNPLSLSIAADHWQYLGGTIDDAVW